MALDVVAQVGRFCRESDQCRRSDPGPIPRRDAEHAVRSVRRTSLREAASVGRALPRCAVLLFVLGAAIAPVSAASADPSALNACRRLTDFDGQGQFNANERKRLKAAAVSFRNSDERGAKKIGKALNTAKSDTRRQRGVERALEWCDDEGFAVPPTTTTTTTLPPPTPPQVATGQGDSVIEVTFPPQPGLAHIVGSGTGNFIVHSFDATGQQLDLLVNEIGAYDGVRPINFLEGLTVARIQIGADGPWTIEIKPLTDAAVAPAPGHYDGSGDQVLRIGGVPDTAHFNATGASANFIARSYGTTPALLVNEIAPYEGTVIVPSDASLFLEVVATGPWSVDFT